MTLGQAKRALETRWPCDHHQQFVGAMSSAVKRTFDKWQADRSGGASLRAIKTKPGLSRYLAIDGKRLAMLRARLRFNRSSLNHSLYRRGLTESRYCSTCGDGVDETADHVVMHCPAFDATRYQVRCALSYYRLPLSTPLALGHVENTIRRPHTHLLSATAPLLHCIHSIRVI